MCIEHSVNRKRAKFESQKSACMKLAVMYYKVLYDNKDLCIRLQLSLYILHYFLILYFLYWCFFYFDQ